MMVPRKPRILLVSTQSSPATEDLARGFAAAGFELGAILPKHATSGDLREIAQLYEADALHFRHGAEKAILEFMPDRVVPCDDLASRHLHELHGQHFRGSGRLSAQIVQTIEDSLGDANYYQLVSKTSNFLRFARRFGLPVPKNVEFTSEPALLAFLATQRFPLLLKADGCRESGEAEHLHHRDEAVAAYRRVMQSSIRVDKALAEGDFGSLRDLFDTPSPTVSVQEYIDGMPAGLVVICRDGLVLAGAQTGDATAAADRKFMNDTAAFIVGRLGLSGFYAFDFRLECDTGRVLLIDIHPHAAAAGTLTAGAQADLLAALFDALSEAPERTGYMAENKIVALFPQEWPSEDADEQDQFRAGIRSAPDLVWSL